MKQNWQIVIRVIIYIGLQECMDQCGMMDKSVMIVLQEDKEME